MFAGGDGCRGSMGHFLSCVLPKINVLTNIAAVMLRPTPHTPVLLWYWLEYRSGMRLIDLVRVRARVHYGSGPGAFRPLRVIRHTRNHELLVLMQRYGATIQYIIVI